MQAWELYTTKLCRAGPDEYCQYRQDLQMRLLSLFVDFALQPMAGKQIWDLGALLPAIASISLTLQTPHVLAQKKASGHSFGALQMHQDEDPNRIKVSSMCSSGWPL